MKELLKKQYSLLSEFSDISWQEISDEFQEAYSPKDDSEALIQFPMYLQEKAEEGDCPEYLFELAYYLLAQSEVMNSEFLLSKTKGLHLNPTASFLRLEFDVPKMISDKEISEKDHVLCIAKTSSGTLICQELNSKELEILSFFENGPIQGVTPEYQHILENLLQKDLIISILN
ncbi:MAG: hypothetical protein AB7I27_09490 [Bacteriovoracaceae bacterium]